MADFLSPEWFQGLNESLERADATPFPETDAATVRVVIEFPDAPSNGPHAITFSIWRGRSSASNQATNQPPTPSCSSPSPTPAALTGGDIDSASALRDGRARPEMRGDINAIVPLLNWLQRAHPSAK